MNGIIALCIVLAAILGAAALAVRLMAKTKTLLGGPLGMRVIERVALSQGVYVSVVEIGSQVYVVGSSASGVRRLGKIGHRELDAARERQRKARAETSRSWRWWQKEEPSEQYREQYNGPVGEELGGSAEKVVAIVSERDMGNVNQGTEKKPSFHDVLRISLWNGAGEKSPRGQDAGSLA